MERKYFGTDGIRGQVGEFPILPDFVLKLGWAAGKVLSSGRGGKVLIGKDTRISGYMFESALEAGLSAAGKDTLLLGPMPTPAIAYLTRTLRADAGIVISASHNPYEDNGIKFFSADGLKLPDAVELEIEATLELPMTMVPSRHLGKATRVKDAAGRYVEFCKSTFPRGMDLKGVKIVVDCANGATYQVAIDVFSELGAEVIAIGNQPNGLNINVNCGSTHPEALQQRVLKEQADLGIALDGDGDRLIMVDHQGNLVDGDEILYIIANYQHSQSRIAGVVGTLMSNLGLEQALARQGIALYRANVGDRYVIAAMLERNWLLGGESSGHIIALNHITTGDGIIAALQVLAAMISSGNSLQTLRSGMEKLPQVMINVAISGARQMSQHPELQQAVTHEEGRLQQRGRILLRPSGTEPLLRVMVEGEDAAEIHATAERLAELVRLLGKPL
ncbi:MAG: phosphoglucosamine mutase [Gammaproteobacteria bacterium]|nr:phosphoglucosamine mutase [Gammaproteobacteria bacterium]